MNRLLAREASLCYRHEPGATNRFEREMFNLEDCCGAAPARAYRNEAPAGIAGGSTSSATGKSYVVLSAELGETMQEPSRTAIGCAAMRGRYRFEADQPWILDDPFALILIGPTWPEMFALHDTMFSSTAQQVLMTAAVARARYAEDRLMAGVFDQFVILGAGLDSFAWRRPDLLRRGLRVFEVDHPATQAFKRKRAVDLALTADDQLVHVPCDLERDELRDALDRAGFDWSAPSLFSCMGVTNYLTLSAINETLSLVASSGPGTEVALDYSLTDEVDDAARETLAAARPFVHSLGERWLTGFSRNEAEALLADCGLAVADHPTVDDMNDRYFAQRQDGLRYHPIAGFITGARRN
jgi:methyltransferase (TIGR00027 family)